ncbi:MAG: hypothetical protein Q8T08_03395, partial [Ignavibacteria bacterium]|nr:hypothetical protein [Ignavibacteria bacterium]
IIDSIKNNQSITSAELSFCWRNLSLDEANSLMHFIVHSPSLSSLCLEASLDDPLLYKLSETLKHDSLSLTKLKIGSTVGKQNARPLSEESVGSFFQALGVNKSLKSLQLDFPPFLLSIQILAEALKLNKTLKVLALPNESLGDEGINYLVEGLKDNTSVTEIDFSDNNISNTGANSILDMLAINQTLTTLHLTGNSISSSKKAEINKILDKRKIPSFNFSREISLP